MSTASVQMRLQLQTEEKAYPRKVRCAFTQRGIHYFIASERKIFCSKECQKADERDRPR